MKPAPQALINYLESVRASPDAQLIFADVFKFTLNDGTVLAYTNQDVTFTYGGTTYLANSVRVMGLKYTAKVGLEVDKQQITCMALSTDAIPGGVGFLQALRDGSFDGCEIERDRVFFSDTIGGTAVGSVELFHGRLGQVDEIGRTSATLTVNSDLILLDIDMPRNIYQATCLHTLYDSGCTLNQNNFSATGNVGAGSTPGTINWSGANQNYVQGQINFTSGVNAGVTATVQSAVNGSSLTLIYPLESPPSTGDAFTIFWGCDHTPATCQAKFNNFVNFRGFPFVPPPQMAF